MNFTNSPYEKMMKEIPRPVFRKTLLRYVDFCIKHHAIVIAPLVFTNPGCLLRRYRP